MIVRKVSVIAQSEGASVPSFNTGTGCSGCHAHCNESVPALALPGDHAGDYELALSFSNLFAVLCYSLGLPLLGFLAAACLGALMNWSEPVTVFVSLLGLAIATRVAPTQTFERRFTMKEVTHVAD